MFKRFSLITPVLLLAACGATSSSNPEMFSFFASESGIKGSYNAATYSQAHVRARVAGLACKSGKLESYSETNKDGIVKFDSACVGPQSYEESTAFTVNDVQKTGHITTSMDGQLIQKKL